jgi:hypothetical protein
VQTFIRNDKKCLEKVVATKIPGGLSGKQNSAKSVQKIIILSIIASFMSALGIAFLPVSVNLHDPENP